VSRTSIQVVHCTRSPSPAKEGEAMKNGNDGKPWTEMDVRALMAALRVGETIEEAADHLCRSGSVNDVRRKAEELGLKYKSQG
jgi:hypothetical protein